METMTSQLQKIDTGSGSILPTGRLKIQDDILYQEAEVIAHKNCNVRIDGKFFQLPIGIHVIWINVPSDFVKKILSDVHITK